MKKDPIALLKKDHQTVKQLFARFDKLGENATRAKQDIVDQLIAELSKHAAIEEQFFYPYVKDRIEDAKDIVLESLEEHHIVKWTLHELEGLKPEDEAFDAKMSVLKEMVLHHAQEEETELFPQVRAVLEKEELEVLGEALEKGKLMAPTHPHPRAPSTPPANFVAGTMAKVIDTGRDLFRGRKVRQLATAAKTRRR